MTLRRGRSSVYVASPIALNKDILNTAFTFDTLWLADELHRVGLLSSDDYESVSTAKTQMKDSDKSRVLVDSLVRKEGIDSGTSKKLLQILPKKGSLYDPAIDVLKKTTYSSASYDDAEVEKKSIEEPILKNNASEISQKKPKDPIQGIDYESYIQKIQFVLVTQTDNELNAATMFMIGPDCENNYSPSNATKIAEGVYVGIFGKQHVGLLQVSNCTDDLINKLEIFVNAKYIIALGVCYGFPQKDVKMGDVIISKKIFNLGIFEFDDELNVYPKAYSIDPIHKDIYSIFHSKEKSFEYMDVAIHRKFVLHQGLVVSSPSPIANKKIRDSIYKLQTMEQPYGGETQGCDLLKLQKEKQLQIIVIKGVASEGIKRTHDQSWQYTSSKAACYYVQHKLKGYKDLTGTRHRKLNTSASATEKTPPTRSWTSDTENTQQTSSGTAAEENLSEMLLKAMQSPTSAEKLADVFVKALQSHVDVERLRQTHSDAALTENTQLTSSCGGNTGETKETSSGATNVEKKSTGKRFGSTGEENLQDKLIKEFQSMRTKRINSGGADTEEPQQRSSGHLEDVKITKQMSLDSAEAVKTHQTSYCGANAQEIEETSSGATNIVMKAKGRTSDVKSDENWMETYMKELQNYVDRVKKQTSSGATTEKNLKNMIQKVVNSGATEEELWDFLTKLQNEEATRQTKTSSVVSDDTAHLLAHEEKQTPEASKVSSKNKHHRGDPVMQPDGHVETNHGAVDMDDTDDSKAKAAPTEVPEMDLKNICQKTLQNNENRWIAMGVLFGFLSFICYVIAISLAWVLNLSIFPGNSLTLGGAVIISLPLLTTFAYFGVFVAVIYGKHYILKIIVTCSGVLAVLLEILAAAVLIIAGSQSERPSNNVLSYGLSSGFFAVFAASLCAISTSILTYVFIKDYIKITK